MHAKYNMLTVFYVLYFSKNLADKALSYKHRLLCKRLKASHCELKTLIKQYTHHAIFPSENSPKYMYFYLRKSQIFYVPVNYFVQ